MRSKAVVITWRHLHQDQIIHFVQPRPPDDADKRLFRSEHQETFPIRCLGTFWSVVHRHAENELDSENFFRKPRNSSRLRLCTRQASFSAYCL